MCAIFLQVSGMGGNSGKIPRGENGVGRGGIFGGGGRMCIFGKIWEDEMCKIPSMFSPPSLSFLLPTYPKYFRSPCKSVYIKHLERERESKGQRYEEKASEECV